MAFVVDAPTTRRLPVAVSTLRIEPAGADETLLRDWQHVHNVVIPTAVLSFDEVRERAQRYQLDVAYVGDVLVGCLTVRPPASDAPAATVIARVLPAHRGRGFGGQLYAYGLTRARQFGAAVETVVLASNLDGLRFAKAHGFVEVERYLLPGDSIPYVTLRLA
jgi:GNAT superfamily N-acetyltransferase